MQTIQLNKLTVSEKYNVRLTDRENGLEELSASIRAHGLLENLLVTQSDNDNFEVIAGGRRLSALKILQKQGFIADDYTVPCEIVAAENAVEISLAENMVRVTMHPADQFEAWARLVENGLNIRDIATRFGETEKLITQRLKLGRLSPALMSAYRADEIKLDSLMAFTITDDKEKQDELYNRIAGTWELGNPRHIRDALTETSLNGKNRLVKFVGVEEYKGAGGLIHHDLFSEDDGNYFDKDLITELATAKLEEKAEEYKNKWAWVEIFEEFGYEEKARYHTIRPSIIGEIPEELAARYDEVSILIDEMDSNEEEGEEYDALTAEYKELEEKLASYQGFTEDEYAIGGCVITISYSGELEILEGLVKPEDKKQFNEAYGSPAVAKEKPRYSNPLMERLKNYRLHSVKMAMANDFATAFDSALYAMCVKSYSGSNWLKTSATEYSYPLSIFEKDDTGEAIKKKEEKLFKKLPLAWLDVKGEKERFVALCALDEKKKQKLFAACIAKSLNPQLSIDKYASPVFEAIIERMGVDVAHDMRPTADNFFNRVAKAELLAIGAELFGESFISKNQTKPKGDIVLIIHRAFEKPDQKAHTKEQSVKLKTWLPEGM